MSKAARSVSPAPRPQEVAELGPGGYLRHAAALSLADAAIAEPDAVVLDASVQILAPHRGGPIRSEIAALPGAGERRLWQVVLRDRAGTALAVVSQTHLTTPPAPPTTIPPPPEAEGLTTIAEARRRRILDAALPAMAARGFANATMREIAAAAGLHVPTMYQYARSKEELLLMIFEDSLDRSIAEMERVAALPGSATSRLRAAVDSLVQKSERRRAEIRLFAREAALLPPPLRARMHARWATALGAIERILRDGIAGGEFHPVDTEVTAHLIESLCEAWSLRRFVMRRLGVPNVVALIQRLLSSGLQPERPLELPA
jgi:AcrR family transcriptional regulator